MPWRRSASTTSGSAQAGQSAPASGAGREVLHVPHAVVAPAGAPHEPEQA